MANIVDIWGETQASIIGDDSSAALTLKNSSTGPGLRAYGLVCTSTATIDKIVVGTIASNDSTGVAIQGAAAGYMSIGILKILGNSVASGAVLEFKNRGAFASITSCVFTTASNTDYAIRVQVGLETRWIPCYKDAAMIGMAAIGATI